MNQILLSFLCGAAFIGGAAVTVCMVALAVSLKEKSGREKLYGYWQSSIDNHKLQLSVLGRIAEAWDAKRKP